MDAERAAKEIGDFIVDRITKQGKGGGVLGLSGGVDSTIVAAIAKRAFDAYNADHPDAPLELVGYLLPSTINDQCETDAGESVAQRLGIRYESHSIEPLAAAHARVCPEVAGSKYDRGNMLSRIRANVLSTKSATEKKTLLGTGNKDEDVGLGYYTLFGDGAVHVSPIGNLSKRLVREMACHLGFADIAKRTPTAGLEPGQTDFGDLGYSYDVVEIVTEGFAQGFRVDDLVSHSQVLDVVAKSDAEFREEFGAPKFSSTRDLIGDIKKRYDGARKKAALISPPIAPVSLEYR